jgi:cell division protein FtsB
MTPGVIPCESMFVVDEIRRRARAITGPVLAISLVCYFAYHLFVGDRGLIAWLHLTQQLRDGKATLAALDSERRALDHRVGLLRPDHLDPDMLDERARAALNLAGPDEIVIQKDAGPKP